jgi:hypothetical protein
MRPRNRALAFMLGSCLLVACEGSREQSTRSRELASADTPSTLGFSLSDFLAKNGGSLAGSFQWASAGQPDVQQSPADATTSLILEVALGKAPVREVLVDSTRVSCNGADACSSRLETTLSLHIATADGALDETTSATLRVIDPRRGGLSARLDPGRLMGTLRVTSGSSLDLALEAAVMDGTSSGTLVAETPVAEVSRSGSGSTTGIVRTIGRWPAP